MDIQFEVAADGRRRAVTTGLAAINQRELAVDVAASIGDGPSGNLLRYVADYIQASQQLIQPGDSMRYGWSTLRFALMPPDPCLLVGELADPFTSGSDKYVGGAARAIAIIRDQDAAVQRNGMAAPAHHPHRDETAVICQRVAPGTAIRVLVFDRLPALSREDSGWFIGCGDRDHNHNDPNELFQVHLVRLAELDPRTVYYLAMPEGARIVFERRQVIVFPPGQQEGRFDEGGQ